MKFSKKMSLALGLSVALATSIVSTSMAADCANAQILRVGTAATIGSSTVAPNVITVKCLSDLSWGSAQFYPNILIGDQALATALTALSLGKNVWVSTSAKTSGSMLNVIYVNN